MLDRKDVDAVIIATPDHWHALPAIQAVLAGKDVYVEKPVGAQRRRGPGDDPRRPQDQPDHGRRHPAALVVALPEGRRDRPLGQARQGLLGPDLELREHQPRPAWASYPDGEAPSYVDYDRWLGPAPVRPFNPNRFHLLFRWFFDYAGGMMSDWGVHLNDIVLWALDAKGPKSVYTTGGIFTTDDDRDTPDTLQVVYEFPECTLTYSMRKGNGLKFNGHDYGILFCGTDGSLMLDRSGLRGHPRQDRPALRHQAGPRRSPAPEDRPQAREGQGRRRPGRATSRNFLECLKTRRLPTCDIEIAHRSTNTCHLGNIAYKLGRKLDWDVETETFKNDPEANALLAREPRKGYELPDGLKPDLEIFMMRRTAQWLRMIGLLIELVGVVGVVRERGGKEFPQVQVPGGPLVSSAWVAVVLGFVIWLIGRILLASARPSRRETQ